MPHRHLAAACLPFIIAMTASCSSTSEQDSTDRDSAGVVESAGDVGVFALQVGDCFDDPSLAAASDATVSVEEVAAVPCDTPHDFQAYAEFDIDDAEEYPGDQIIFDQAETGCVAQFEPFVGLSYQESRLDFSYLYPTTETWEVGDREVLCSLADPTGEKLTADLRGSAE